MSTVNDNFFFKEHDNRLLFNMEGITEPEVLSVRPDKIKF